MRTFTVVFTVVFFVLATFTLRSCYYEIADPFNCEGIWPLAKGDQYYQCVKARAFHLGFTPHEDGK